MLLRSVLSRSLVCASVSLLWGCSRQPETPLPPNARLVTLPLQDVAGLSGLARDDGGSFFTVPELDRVLVEMSAAGALLHRYPLGGIPAGIELESIAWLAKDRFAVGTEGGCKDGAEHVLLIQREGDGAKVTRDIALPLSAWGAECDEKRGVEGLCATSGQVIAAIEKPLAGKSGERMAALAKIDEATGAVTAYRLALTSKEGKISALDCRMKDGAIEVLAVERHFSVSRLLVFTLPAQAAAHEVPRQAQVVLDLVPYADGGKRNFEGAVWIDDRHAMLVVDNKYGTVTGPNEILEVELPNP